MFQTNSDSSKTTDLKATKTLFCLKIWKSHHHLVPWSGCIFFLSKPGTRLLNLKISNILSSVQFSNLISSFFICLFQDRIGFVFSKPPETRIGPFKTSIICLKDQTSDRLLPIRTQLALPVLETKHVYQVRKNIIKLNY